MTPAKWEGGKISEVVRITVPFVDKGVRQNVADIIYEWSRLVNPERRSRRDETAEDDSEAREQAEAASQVFHLEDWFNLILGIQSACDPGLIFDASACYSPLEDGAGLISSDWLDAFLFR